MGATGAAGTRVTSVAITGVPSFVHSAGVSVRIGTRKVTVDIAFGGEFYAIADSEAIGIPIDMAQAAALAHMGREIKDAVESTVHVQHPLDRSCGISRARFLPVRLALRPICGAPPCSMEKCCADRRV